MSEQARRIIDGRREGRREGRRGEMVELKDHQQQGTEGKVKFHEHLTLIACTFPSLKVQNLRVFM